MLRERTTLSPFPKPFSLLPPISCTKPSRPGGESTHSDGGPPPAAPHAGTPPSQRSGQAQAPGGRSATRGCAHGWREPPGGEGSERASPHPESSAARGTPRRRGSSKGRADGVSPSHHFSLPNLSFRSVLLHPAPPSLPAFSHLCRLEHPAFPTPEPGSDACSDPSSGDPGPAPLPGPPLPGPSAQGLTQKSRLKPSSRYLMQRRPPRKRPMLRPGGGIPSPQAGDGAPGAAGAGGRRRGYRGWRRGLRGGGVAFGAEGRAYRGRGLQGAGSGARQGAREGPGGPQL